MGEGAVEVGGDRKEISRKQKNRVDMLTIDEIGQDSVITDERELIPPALLVFTQL